MVKKTLKDLGLEMTELSKVMNNMNENMEVLGREQEVMRNKLSEFENEKIVNKCETCNQVYKSKLELKKHQLTHKTSSASPFECNFCERKFNEEWKMIAHASSHSKCDHCDKTFKYEEIKQKHISIHIRISRFTVTVLTLQVNVPLLKSVYFYTWFPLCADMELCV